VKAALDAERLPLIAAAWNTGERNVTELARLAGVTRDTVYADLRTLGIDYKSKGDDPRVMRILEAVIALNQALPRDASGLDWATPARLDEPITRTLAALATGAGPDLVPAVTAVLDADIAPEDRATLKPQLDELAAALSAYQNPPKAPFTRAMQGQPAGRLKEVADE
jgi:hypothetical protein